MIQSLKIKNFQSHRDSSLEFHPGVNVIVGGSDSGKTAIIRALKWLVWNRPSGDTFRSTWGGDTRVDIEAENQHWFRLKGKENHYHYNGGTFAAFGSGVPEEVQKSLNIDNTNLQNQLDAPFLISSSPGEVASYFNKIAHLDQIDTGLKNIQADIRRVTGEIQSDGTRVDELGVDLKAYDYLDWAEIELEVLEKDQEDLIKREQGAARLRTIIGAITTVEEEIEQASVLTKLEKDVDAILLLYKEAEEATTEHILLKQTRLELIELEAGISTLNHKIQLEKTVDTIISEIDHAAEMDEKVQDFKDIVQDLEETSTNLVALEQKVVDLEQQFHEELGDQCPLCGTNLRAKMTKS